MADDPIKFRCYRCGKLLGAAARRAGSVVSCPQCGSEIEVPAPRADADDRSQPSEALGSEDSAEPFLVAVAEATDPVPAIPPIRIDAPPLGPSPAAVPRAPDVVLPPGVVMAWSLLVLLALPLAFLSGLLIGHFVWK